MSSFEYYKQALQKYAEFKGRANRSQYWYFVLYNTLIGLALTMIGEAYDSLSILSALYGLGIVIPSLAVAVRRLHDTNRSGWWLLINLLPVIGQLVLLYFYILPGDKKANKYGTTPKLIK